MKPAPRQPAPEAPAVPGRRGRKVSRSEAYRLFLLASPTNGVAGRRNLHDSAETHDLDELADLFARLPTRRLAGAWHGLMVDSFLKRPDSWTCPGAGGSLTRALNIVAVRLGHNRLRRLDEPHPTHLSGGGGATPDRITPSLFGDTQP